MQEEEYRTSNRRRIEQPTVLVKLSRAWIGLSTIIAAGTSIFLMFGFEFRTPASWQEENKKATQELSRRIDAVDDRVKLIENVMIILARDACSRLTKQQLLVTPQCDIYIIPRR